MSLMARSARYFMVIKAAREIRQEIEKAGLDNLKMLCERGVSIVGTYLNGCTPKEQARLRQQFGAMGNFGITPEMVLDAVALQMPDLAPIMGKRPDYKKNELQKVNAFLKG